MDHRILPPTENTSDHARLTLQPREVKFCDLMPPLGKRQPDSPLRNDKRGFRPAPKLAPFHAARGTKTPLDAMETESGDEEERRRGGRRRGGGLDGGGAGHGAKAQRARAAKTPKTSPQLTNRMEISGNAAWGEDYGITARSALAVLEKCVTHERRLKEELAQTHAAKMVAFRSVMGVYLASVRQCGKPMIGRRKAGVEVALAQCAVVATTLVVTIQSYIRAFQSRKHTTIRRCFRRSGLTPDLCNNSTEWMPRFKKRDHTEVSVLSGTTSSLQDLLDEKEISRLKQLYFDYYDCDVYVIPGTRPHSGVPPGALLLTSLSAYDPFLPDVGNGRVRQASLSASSSSSSSVE